MLTISKINVFLIIFALYITNFNVINSNSGTYLKNSPREDALSYAGYSVIMIGDIPSSIGLTFFEMKYKTSYGWSEKQINYLKNNYSNTDNELISKKLKKNKSTIVAKANILGLKKSKNYMSSLKSKINESRKVKWSKKEINYLIKNYGTKTVQYLADYLGKRKKSVIKKLNELKLFKSPSQIQKIHSIANKKNGRDLNYNFIKEVAKKFNTRHEFYLRDTVAYSTAIRNGWLNEVCKHMKVSRFSIPQLILKDILEHIINEKCSYNDKKIIKPLEIDCYFPNLKIGWEYNGIYYHTDIKKDRHKINVCKKIGIKLFTITETKNCKNLKKIEENIKTQLISQLKEINRLSKTKIKVSDIKNHKPEIAYPNLLTVKEKNICYNKSMTEIRLINEELFNKIKKHKLHSDESLKIKYDLKRYNYFKSFTEYCNYLTEKGYKTFYEITINEHPHRVMKKLNIPISKLRNKLKI